MSVREAEVLALLGEHLTHSEIAGRLFLSVRTVESHVASLRRKLAIPGHRELVRYAAAQRGATPAPLPLPLTSFVGRARELSDLAGRLLAHRLVSVVGPGGAGKTRLAQTVMSHVQDRFAGRVSYVDLVPVSEPAGVPAAVAEACGVADLPGRDTIAALLRGLGEQPTLLVLDNCEHVVNAVALLVESLVSGCPLLHVLVTSRARLVLPFEQVFTLGGLSAGGDAVELFVQRAVSAGWQAPDGAQLARIGEVCRSLDGLALAIELAAVRVPALGLEGVERGLGDHEALLVSGPRVGHRHRSMHDTLEWSFRLLAPAEQAVLCRVSVFAAGFTVDAATSVAAYGGVRTADVRAALGRLVDQSLVVPVASMPDRWRLLEPVRQYAGARMDADDATAYAMHLDWADREARHLTTLSERPGRTWQGPLDEVVDDLRSALEWAAHQDLHHEEATALADRLATLLFRSGRTREAQARYEQAARLATDPRTEGEALERAVAVARSRVLGEEALRLGLAAVQARRRQADEDALGDSLAAVAETVLRFEGMFAGPVPTGLAAELLDEVAAIPSSDPTARTAALVARAHRVDPADPQSAQVARQVAERVAESAHRRGDRIRESAALDILTATHMTSERPVEAARVAARRVALFDGLPVEPTSALELKDALHMGALAGIGAGDLASACAYGDRHRSLVFLREQRDLAVEAGLAPDALVGRWRSALAAGEVYLTDWTASGRPTAAGRAIGPAAVALVHGLRGDDESRDTWLRAVATLRGVDPARATKGSGYGGVFDAILLLHKGKAALARVALTEDSDGAATWYGHLMVQWRAALLAEAAALAGDADAQDRCADAIVVASGNPLATAITDRACALASHDSGTLVELAGRFDSVGALYQAARTLVLAGGSRAEDGLARLAALTEPG